MKKATMKWLKVWGYIFAGFAGFPTLGYTWAAIPQFLGHPKQSWQLNLIEAAEDWLSIWRNILVALAGIPTLGFTWALWNKIPGKDIMLFGLRDRIQREPKRTKPSKRR